MLITTSRAARGIAGMQACAVLCSRACACRGAGVGARARSTLTAKADCCQGCQLYDSELCNRGCCQACRARLYSIYIAHNGL